MGIIHWVQDRSDALWRCLALLYRTSVHKSMGMRSAPKRLARVAPEVDLGECTLHSPPQKGNKAEPTLTLKPIGDITRHPKQGYQWPPKRTCVSAKNFLKKQQSMGMTPSFMWRGFEAPRRQPRSCSGTWWGLHELLAHLTVSQDPDLSRI